MENLIIGIDPGTTVGYAVLNINKKLKEIGSLKNIGVNELIERISKKGNVVLVGCDKKKIPKFIIKFAVKFSARIVKPKHDLTVNEKRKLCNNFKYKNKHEMDALASALFAYNITKDLFDSVKRFINENQKEMKIKDKIIEIVLRKGITIKRAYSIIQET